MNCKEGNELMLRQIDALLALVEQDVYARPLDLFNGSTIGQHIRHILNFYEAVVSGATAGLVDYAKRERDPQIEQDPLYARQTFQVISIRLKALDENAALPVQADFIPEEEAPRPTVQSSVGRELMYAFDHAVHHLAIVKMGLRQAQPDLPLQEELGMAPSTLKFQKEQKKAS
ncbi:MAG: hypothetical protein IPL49_15860 [Saprospirales bacterium]|nr:hypothetical protein [Saprospirales bacterium]